MKYLLPITFLALLVLAGCTISPPDLKRALVEPKLVKEAIALANLINSREAQPVPDGESWFKVKRGTLPVVVTVPHATRPFKRRKTKVF